MTKTEICKVCGQDSEEVSPVCGVCGAGEAEQHYIDRLPTKDSPVKASVLKDPRMQAILAVHGKTITPLAALYTIELLTDIEKHPDKYMDTPATAFRLASKMIVALQKGTGSTNSNPLRRACRKLGVPFRYKEIQKAMTPGA